jgi:hypothetical protein
MKRTATLSLFIGFLIGISVPFIKKMDINIHNKLSHLTPVVKTRTYQQE